MNRPQRSSRIVFGLVLLATSAMLGCQSIAANNGSEGLNNSLVMASSIDFGRTTVGGTKKLTETIHNRTASPVTIGAATVEGASFGVSGPRFPFTISPRGSAALTLSFTPLTSGTLTGRVSIVSNGSTKETYIAVSGFASNSGLLGVSPATVTFGNLPVGQRQEQRMTLTNSGDSEVTVSDVTVAGGAFSLSGLDLPQVLAAKQSMAFTAVFSPPADGSFDATISITNNSPSSILNVRLSGSSGIGTGKGGSGGGGKGGSGGNSIPPEFISMQMNSGIVTQQPWPSVSFGGTRLWNSGTHWADINTADGVFDWTTLDKWLADAQLYNVDVLYTFGEGPAWASSNPTNPKCDGGPGECEPPNDLNPDGSGPDLHWKNFVAAIVAHSQSSSTAHIKYWEVWNEPYQTWQWTGTNAQLVRMAQDAMAIIKAADPSAMVLSPSVNFTSDGRAWFDGYLAAGGGQHADGIAFHGYVQRRGYTPQPEDFEKNLTRFKTILANHGQDGKPLWDTEAGWGPTSITGFTDPDMQAAFVARFYLMNQSGGVARLYWYQWNAQNTEGTLWVPDRHNPGGQGTVLKPGIAYGQIYNWMVGATLTSPCTANGSVWTCQLNRPNGYQALAVWDVSQTCSHGACGTNPYTYDPLYIKYRDPSGKTSALSGQTVAIGAKPILLENQ
jgi:hypothetical protein